jgi:hypothetical protein
LFPFLALGLRKVSVKQSADEPPHIEGVGDRQTMRNGQNKRMRGRNNRKGQNPLTRVYESNGPDVKIRGTANHVADKYLQLARDAQSSGDPVAAENYLQHAEHYFRLIAAAQEQYRQANPYYRPEGEGREDMREDSMDDGEEGAQPFGGPAPSGFQQPYQPQQHQAREQPQHQPREQPYPPREPQPQPSRGQPTEPMGDGERLPSFITGGPPPAAQGPNGYDGNQGSGDRFPLHRRRRRHRGPRGDVPAQGEGSEESAPRGRPND